MSIRPLNRVNDGTRTLASSIVVPEVRWAFNDWVKNCDSQVMLIGGLAMSYYARPRATMDIDFMVLSGSVPDQVKCFKKTRPHGFLHLETHVEVEVLTANFLKIDTALFSKLVQSSRVVDGVRIPSIEGLIVLKLQRFSLQDQADIAALLSTKATLNLGPWNLSTLDKDRIEMVASSTPHQKPQA